MANIQQAEKKSVSKSRVQTRSHKFPNGTQTFIIEPVDNDDLKKQLLNKGFRTVAALFERDKDGDHVLANALTWLREVDNAAYQKAIAGIPSLIQQLRKLG